MTWMDWVYMESTQWVGSVQWVINVDYNIENWYGEI